jgi:MG2 domain
VTMGPNALRPGRDFEFTVSSNGLQKSLSANFTLSGNNENGTKVEMMLINRQIRANSFEKFKFDVSLILRNMTKLLIFFNQTCLLSPGSYSLIIDVYDKFGKASYHDVQPLTYRKKKFSAFIYTDKGMYKGGDTVKFSIFSIDSETKPYNPKLGSVNVYDSGDLKIKSFVNITFAKGKYKASLVLADLAAKGEWKLKFDAEEEVKKTLKSYLSAEVQTILFFNRVLRRYSKFRITFYQHTLLKLKFQKKFQFLTKVSKQKSSLHTLSAKLLKVKQLSLSGSLFGNGCQCLTKMVEKTFCGDPGEITLKEGLICSSKPSQSKRLQKFSM